MSNGQRTTVGLLLSGGVDSTVLLGHLLEKGYRVRPIYVRSQLFWEACEREAINRVLAALAGDRLAELVELELPVEDLYGPHWSLTGRGVPDATTEDEAVYLPGRNPLLLVKAAIWCQLHGIEQLALALLASNPFRDATPQFFTAFESALRLGTEQRLEVIRPFAGLEKRQVMELGRIYPLELTFSCIAPVDSLHCGRCNKCAERRAGFQMIGLADPTRYACSGG